MPVPFWAIPGILNTVFSVCWLFSIYPAVPVHLLTCILCPTLALPTTSPGSLSADCQLNLRPGGGTNSQSESGRRRPECALLPCLCLCLKRLHPSSTLLLLSSPSSRAPTVTAFQSSGFLPLEGANGFPCY